MRREQLPANITQIADLVDKYALEQTMESGDLSQFKNHFNNVLEILYQNLIGDRKDSECKLLPDATQEQLKYLADKMRESSEMMEKDIKATNNRDEMEISPILKMFYGIEDKQLVDFINPTTCPYGIIRKVAKIDESKKSGGELLAVSLYDNDIKLLGYKTTAPNVGEIVKGKFILRPITPTKEPITTVDAREIVTTTLGKETPAGK